VAIEGPIHIDEVARRITTAFGKTKAGSRIVEATGRAVRQALRQDPTLMQDGPFLMTQAQAAASCPRPFGRNRQPAEGRLYPAMRDRGGRGTCAAGKRGRCQVTTSSAPPPGFWVS
jgi:hypothetical protein